MMDARDANGVMPDWTKRLLVLPCSAGKAPANKEDHGPSILQRVGPETARLLADCRATKGLSVSGKPAPSHRVYTGGLYRGLRDLPGRLDQGLHCIILSGGYGAVLAQECIQDYNAKLRRTDWGPGVLERVLEDYCRRHCIEQVEAFASTSSEYAHVLRRVQWPGNVQSAILHYPEKLVSGGNYSGTVPIRLGRMANAWLDGGSPESALEGDEFVARAEVLHSGTKEGHPMVPEPSWSEPTDVAPAEPKSKPLKDHGFSWSGPVQVGKLLDGRTAAAIPPADGVYLVSRHEWKDRPDPRSRPLYVGGNTGSSLRFRTRVGDLVADLFGFYSTKDEAKARESQERGHHSGGQTLHAWCLEHDVDPRELYIEWATRQEWCGRCEEVLLYDHWRPLGLLECNRKPPTPCPRHAPDNHNQGTTGRARFEFERSDVLAALDAISQQFPGGFEAASSTKYDLVHEGRRYPPKLVAEYAFRHRGAAVARSKFKGGQGLNDALRRLGFTIARKEVAS